MLKQREVTLTVSDCKAFLGTIPAAEERVILSSKQSKVNISQDNKAHRVKQPVAFQDRKSGRSKK